MSQTISRLVDPLAVAHPADLSLTVERTLGDGSLETTLWVSDVAGEKLADLSRLKGDLTVIGTLAGRAYRELETIVAEDRLVTPLESLGRVVGVLEIYGDDLANRADELRTAARVITDRLIGAKGHSDEVERARGAGNLGLAATIQYDLMPIPSYLGDHVEIGGWIEPAYDIAGDGWDYAVNAHEVDFGIFDSVGHGLRATELTMVALGSFRLARRRGGSLDAVTAEIEEGLAKVVQDGEFVTGIAGRAFIDQSRLEMANAGHLAPFRLRDGIAELVDWEPALPFGLSGKKPSLHFLDYQPQDKFYLFSDGVIEATDEAQNQFGADSLGDLLERAAGEQRRVSVTCRQVLRAVSGHVGGPLRDDATVFGVRFS